MSDTQATCATCLWWERENIITGRCHAQPPIVRWSIDQNAFWPRTFQYHWCGQHPARRPGTTTPAQGET